MTKDEGKEGLRCQVSGRNGMGQRIEGHRDKKKDVAGCELRVAGHGLGISGLRRRCMGQRAEGREHRDKGEVYWMVEIGRMRKKEL